MLFAILAGINIVEFHSLEARGPSSFDLKSRDHADILRWSMAPGGNAWSRYSIDVALSLLAPGSTIVIPATGAGEQGRLEQRLFGFGDAARVVDGSPVEAPDPELGLPEHGYVAASGDLGNRGASWTIVFDDRNPPFVAMPQRNEYVLRFAAMGAEAVPRGGPRRLVLASAPRDDEYGFENVLIEASLVERPGA